MSLRLLLGSAAAVATLAACSGSDVSFGSTTATTTITTSCDSGFRADANGDCTILDGVLMADATLTAANSPYVLDGQFEVGVDVGGDGSGGTPVTLTIEPGVEVRGAGFSDYFLVNRGSSIEAVGTPTEPIVFTSVTAAAGTSTAPGQWGGLVILGRAPITECDDVTETQGTATCELAIEGLVEERLFGGDEPTDSSGTLSYVQVKYAGFEVVSGSGNELNGISFGGVGSGTQLDHIQIHNNLDDGIEFFGGTASASNLVLTGIGDDSIDLDLGYSGSLQYILSVQNDTTGDNLFELSSASAGIANPTVVGPTNPNIANFTVLGGDAQGGFGIRLNSGHIGSFFNGIVVVDNATGGAGGGTPCFRWEDAGDDNGVYSATLDPSFDGVAFNCIGITDADSDPNGITVAPLALLDGGNNAGLDGVGAETGTAYVTTLANTGAPADFTNDAAEAAITPVTLPTLAGASAFDAAGSGYIGAVENAGDTWWSFACGLEVSNPC